MQYGVSETDRMSVLRTNESQMFLFDLWINHENSAMTPFLE